MAANLAQVRFQYTLGMQAVAKLLIQLYNGAGLSGTFLDAELALNANTMQMLGVDVGTYTANLNTVQAAMSSAIVQNMEKCVGIPT
jgi:hypothetical protein